MMNVGDSCSRRAFTLIETLVVLGIVAVVVTLLVSVIRDAKTKGYGLQCMANLRANVTAARQWSADNNGMFPTDRVRNDIYTYLGIESPSVRMDTTMSCPLVQSQEATRTIAAMHATYSMNQYLTSSWGGDVYSWQNVRYFHNIERQDRVYFFMDGSAPKPGSTQETAGQPNYRALVRIGLDHYFPHNDGLNIAYVDGSVRWMSEETFMLPENQNIKLSDNPWGVPVP